MYQILKETTKWDCPNHTYVLGKNGKLIAYQPVGGELQILTTPISFQKARRTFETKRVKEYLKYF
jgi:hypothetical protein